MHAAIASAFSDKASTWLKRAINPGDHRIGVLNPVQHCVAEHSIELFLEGQSSSAHHMGIKPEHSRGFNLRSAGINGDNFTPKLYQFFGERPISAAQVENALSGLGRQQFHDGRSQIGNEAGVAGVACGVPSLRSRHDGMISHTRDSSRSAYFGGYALTRVISVISGGQLKRKGRPTVPTPRLT